MRNARFRNVDRARRASAASCRRRASRTTSSSTSRPTRRSTGARATHEEPRHTAKTLLLHDRDGASRSCSRTAAVREEPLEAAGDRDSQDSRLPRRDQVRVRHTPGKGERVSRHKVMDPIADPEGDLPLKEHDLLILARVDVDREPVTERFLGLPSAEPSVALRRLHVNDDHGAGEPDTGRNQGRGSITRLCQGGQSSRELSAALRDQRERGGRDADCRDDRKQCLRSRIACLDARRVPASAALARTTGVPLRGRLRRFGVLHALLGGHLPHDERPGVHLAIEVALPLLLAMLLAFLWCRHGFSLVVCQSQRYASVVLLPAAQVDGAQPSRTARRTHGHSLRKSVRRSGRRRRCAASATVARCTRRSRSGDRLRVAHLTTGLSRTTRGSSRGVRWAVGYPLTRSPLLRTNPARAAASRQRCSLSERGPCQVVGR